MHLQVAGSFSKYSHEFQTLSDVGEALIMAQEDDSNKKSSEDDIWLSSV